MPDPLLTRRAVLLAEIESTYNQAEATSATEDAILVGDPAYTLDVTRLQRNFSRNSLSQLPIITGRKLAGMTFTTELRGNGLVQSGNAADAPRMTKLFRACGYNLTALASESAGDVHPVGDHANEVSWADGGTLTNTALIPYILEVTTAGASATAQITVTSPVTGESNAAAVVTTGVAFTVGASGLTLTPTFTGNLALGQKWFVLLKPTGVELEPVSTGFESCTLRMYFDGMLHTMTGARGTFVINAQAGQLPTIQWTFTGQYVAPTDAALPSATFEKTKPAMFELAQLSVDGYDAVVDNVAYTQGNEVQVRPDANSSDGYNGVSITGRTPNLGIDPEATLVADQNFWDKMAQSTQMPFTCRFGSVAGNRVYMNLPSTQYTGLTYADRNSNRVLDASMDVSGVIADDEASFIFA